MTKFKDGPYDRPSGAFREPADWLLYNHESARLETRLSDLLADITGLQPEPSKPSGLSFPGAKTVLCSASPRRRSLLALTGRDFVCKAPAPEFEHELTARLKEPSFLRFKGPECSFQDAAMRSIYLAAGKARQICREEDPDSLGFWIGADTFIWYEQQILEKPADEAEAKDMLYRLSGQKHLVITGVSVLARGLAKPKSPASNRSAGTADEKTAARLVEHTFFHSTAVCFRPLDTWQKAYIDAYVSSGSPLDKAGAYGIQDGGALLVEGIEGDYQNVVGLPVARLARQLDFLEGNDKTSEQD